MATPDTKAPALFVGGVMYNRSRVNGHSGREQLFWLDLVIPQIDTALCSYADNPLVTAFEKSCGDDDLNLSSREQEVLELIWRGKSNSRIGAVLGISPFKVKNRLQRIFGKIGVSKRTQAATRFDDVEHRLRSFRLDRA